MLIKFIFKNFKSFLEESELTLEAGRITELPSNVFELNDSDKFLKTAIIYGANASGKSNVIQAFSFMKEWVLNSFQFPEIYSVIPLKNFKLSEEGRTSDSEFEVYFKINNKEYRYGFIMNEEEIKSEWLMVKKTIKSSKYSYVFYKELTKFIPGITELSNYDTFVRNLDKKTLILSMLSKFEIKDIQNALIWFQQSRVLDYGNLNLERNMEIIFPHRAKNNSQYIKKLVIFLNKFDNGIADFRIVDKDKNDDNLFKSKYVRSDSIYTKHKAIDSDSYIELPLNDESSGTRKMISLYDSLFNVIENGSVLFVDELDAKLHPLLTRYIINIFNDNNINTKNAQLVLTSHDTTVLNNNFFRRDQIWFVQKDINGISELFSLYDFEIDDTKVRKDASFNRDYLSGKYGAIPNLKSSENN